MSDTEDGKLVDELREAASIESRSAGTKTTVATLERAATTIERLRTECERLRKCLSDGGYATLQSEQAWKRRANAAESALSTARTAAFREAAEVARKAGIQLRKDMRASGPDKWRMGAYEAYMLVASALDAKAKEG